MGYSETLEPAERMHRISKNNNTKGHANMADNINHNNELTKSVDNINQKNHEHQFELNYRVTNT